MSRIILYLEMTITKCQRQVKRMYKNRAGTRNNICGEQIRQLREQMVPRTSQRKFADMLQLYGVDLDKNAVQRIESGSRFHAPEAMARLGLRQGMIIVFKNSAWRR